MFYGLFWFATCAQRTAITKYQVGLKMVYCEICYKPVEFLEFLSKMEAILTTTNLLLLFFYTVY